MPDNIGIELKINPSWYDPLLGAPEKVRQYLRR